jgi:hypothetical protein
VIPKSKIGVSIWVLILLDKYLFHRPTYRLLESLRLHDLDLSLGSVTDGLKHLEPLFTPLDEALSARSQQSRRAGILARRRNALAGICHPGEQNRSALVFVGVSCGGRSGVRAVADTGSRGSRRAFRRRRRGIFAGRSLLGPGAPGQSSK